MADGLLLVGKPPGITSHDAIDLIRRALGIRKVGHAGTLDPMASGLLLIGVGRATRLLRFLSDLDKEYEGTATLGVETDTLDADGRVVATSEVRVAEDEVRRALGAFVGEIAQRPPAYSAVKVGGRKLYEAARRGEAVEAPERRVRVDAFDLMAFRPPDVDVRVVCSSGTYVRTLVAGVGARLGCGAHLSRLVRTRIGPYRLQDATAPDRPGDPLPPERAVAHLPRLDLDEDEARAAGHGRPLGPAGIPGPYTVFDPDGRLIGIYRDDGPRARPEVILAPTA
ncbi:MAG: tRNA pseudouridine(55) synthase TruB [Actinomycetota bacterium]|nr:tRNA pseudouridine(55) synthase TruB [Actinomycetota bacterium]